MLEVFKVDFFNGTSLRGKKNKRPQLSARNFQIHVHGTGRGSLDNFNGNLIHVGVAEWKTGRKPDAIRTTLGSCVGVVLYSVEKRAGGIAHVLLADAPPGRIVHRGKYAKPAVESLVADLKKLDLNPADVTARIFGGASMFDAMQSSFLKNVGPDNVRAVHEALAGLKIPISIEETGGTSGRTITLYLDDGRILLRSNGSEKYIYRT